MVTQSFIFLTCILACNLVSCSNCDSTCLTCNNIATNCTSCAYPKYLDDNICVLDCPHLKYKVDNNKTC